MNSKNMFAAKSPISVKIAIGISGLLSGYAAFMAGAGCVVGKYLGPALLVIGVLHLVVAVFLFVAVRGLLRRRRWARRLSVVLSALLATALLIALALSLLAATPHGEGRIFFLIVAILFAVVALSLSTRSAHAWFEGDALPGQVDDPVG